MGDVNGGVDVGDVNSVDYNVNYGAYVNGENSREVTNMPTIYRLCR